MSWMALLEAAAHFERGNEAECRRAWTAFVKASPEWHRAVFYQHIEGFEPKNRELLLPDRPQAMLMRMTGAWNRLQGRRALA